MKSNLDNRTLLEQSPIRTLFFKYALPSVITVLFFGFQNLVDGIVVGKALGSDALAGVNIVLPLYSFIMVISLIVGMGSQTLVSLGMGENNVEKSQNAMTTGFYALTVIALILSVVLYAFMEDFVRLLGANDTLVPHALAYLKGLAIFMLPITLCFYSDAMLKGLGHPKTSMVIMSSIVILNILLSIYFVKVLHWGVMGASVATGIAFCIGLGVSALITFNPKQKLSMLKGRFQWKTFGNAFYNGSSEGVSEMSSAVTIFVVNLAVVKLLGADGVAAFTAINYINFTGVLIFLGISDGLIPVLSYNYGAKNYPRVLNIFRFTALVNATIGVVVFVLLQCFGKSVIRLFFSGNENSKVIEIANEGLHIYAFVFLMSGFNVLITSFFTSLGDAKNSVIIAALRGIVFVMVGVSILPKFMGINGVWTSIPLAEGLTLLVSFALFWKVRQRLKNNTTH
ncbi:MATE family efflux transporter [Capnocytophaga catalasegens]|uniref:Multidrug export protein MepA n=1 Tax=Capnocytophaga catalasegens TaxID=1004260 RepID=A0AAV5AVS3_9FLAO|nr:MATE family efflux transporter [Capnocytophaga catalasegens]GIZ16521.1 MATE family efflux transporter [Capnocytophaga catalasegens]GJM51449.1 MATE family efflux transporter [Capnocytophaga catalasegens]GJM53187.1 MATE family efflux transporter [Capnocytophaga catalasegens]